MRTAFIQQLIKEARNNKNIFLLVGDLGFSVVEPFAKEFPDRYINVGIAEQNMAGIAGGLALNGYIVYCYSIGNFPTLRCIEQIRNDIAYYNSNVRIVAVGAGYAYGSQGMSHHATEDIGMMRAIPGIAVCSPSDPYEAQAITSLSVNHQGPMYIRLGKAGEKIIHSQPIENYKIGDLLTISSTHNVTAVLTSGSIADSVITSIKNKQLAYDIYTVPSIKPINIKQLNQLASQYNEIIIVEEHQKSTGIGSAIIEVLSDSYNDGAIKTFPKIKRVAINDYFLSIVGDQNYLREKANIII